jgi:hypothetical protein
MEDPESQNRNRYISLESPNEGSTWVLPAGDNFAMLRSMHAFFRRTSVSQVDFFEGIGTDSVLPKGANHSLRTWNSANVVTLRPIATRDLRGSQGTGSGLQLFHQIKSFDSKHIAYRIHDELFITSKFWRQMCFMSHADTDVFVNQDRNYDKLTEQLSWIFMESALERITIPSSVEDLIV